MDDFLNEVHKKKISDDIRFSENSKLSHEEETITNTSFILTNIDNEKLENEEQMMQGEKQSQQNDQRLHYGIYSLKGISDGYLHVMTCKARKINMLFGYEYDPVTLKKNKGISGYIVQQVTCSVDRILRLINPQIDYIIEQVNLKMTTSDHQSHVDKTFEIMVTISANDPNSDDADSDANKSDSDVYFKSDDSDSDDEYDYELHKRLTYEKMV
ncbi:hypothetical protein C1645_736232 [Glomus cerebriforme]|uniref:Uncharacterized protein n=1 Tax=Glomus cerebriforme TaxID=658196 RepID=A0A397T8A0_9GLOM|nr:hypothetical protein C1645_736232 [Glomus cerebriforme]